MEAELRENAIAVPRQMTQRAKRYMARNQGATDAVPSGSIRSLQGSRSKHRAALGDGRGIFPKERRRRIVGAVGGRGVPSHRVAAVTKTIHGSLSRAPLGRKPNRPTLVPFREPITLI
jgi:hypothetical protein